MRDGPTAHRERTGRGSLPPGPQRTPPQTGRRLDRTLKHVVDRVFAAVGIIVTAPLFLVVAVTLLALGQRRVLRVEQRIGERGEFPLVTFAHPPAGTHPWLGRVLSGSGLVALPQLFNLLRGDLSLIGPRPRYPGEPRPPARPGMAGLAQAEQAKRVLSRDEVFALDAEYAAQWSLGLDLRLTARGVRAALLGARWTDRR